MNYKYTILFAGIFFFLLSCKKPPNYPNEPQITFEGIDLLPKSSNNIFDTILFTINYKDGDGDLGLNSDEVNSPYNEYSIFFNGTNEVKYGDSGTPFFNNYDYEIIENDTLLVERNPYFYNFNIEYFIEDSKGIFVHQKYRDLCINQNICQPFHGRFTRLSDKNETLEGTIEYFFQSSQFPKARIKFEISIYDRALNQSNIVESTILDLR